MPYQPSAPRRHHVTRDHSSEESTGRHANQTLAEVDAALPAQATPAAAQEQLWQAYHADHSPDSRKALLEAYLPLIRYVAVNLASRLPGSVDVNDLLQEGFLGLNRAIDAFDTGRGVQFSTFAVKRIWGAMMDGLRADDYRRRTQRRRAQRLDSARRELTSEHGRPPTDEELASKLGVTRDQYFRVFVETAGGVLHSLTIGKNEDAPQPLPDAHAEDPVEAAIRDDLKQLLVRGFTRAERLIVVLYYYEDMTMKEIGRTLDISESRVSQMHSLLVQRIKSVLKQWELE